MIDRRFLWSMAFVAMGFGPAIADEPADSLRESVPRTGTRIEQRVVESERLPLNQGYAEMTPENQAIVRSWYDELPDGDEPPYPSRGLGPIYRHIGEAQQALKTTGRLRLDVEIDSKGVAQNVRVLESPDPKVTRVVAAILMQSDYKPGRCAGEPCRMWMPFLMTFRLR